MLANRGRDSGQTNKYREDFNITFIAKEKNDPMRRDAIMNF